MDLTICSGIITRADYNAEIVDQSGDLIIRKEGSVSMLRKISFREKMDMYDKESLKAFAADLWLTKCSQLRKADLIERIAAEFLDSEKLFYRMAILDDAAMEILQSGSKEDVSFPAGSDSYDMACTLNEMELGVISDDRRFLTLSDVWETYEKEIAGEKFEEYRARATWVWKCLRWLENMYVFAPEEIFLKVINAKRKMNMSSEELREIFEHFPNDRVNTLRLEDNYIVTFYLSNRNASENLRRAQGTKDYYIPTAAEVEEYFATGALLSKKPYQDMLKFLTSDMKMEREEAKFLLFDLWDKLTMEDDPHGVMQWFWDQFEFADEALVNKIVSLYMPLTNATNLLVNRGYAPAEMPRPALKPGQMPTIVPGSSNAAKMLSEAMPELQRMGFNIDLDSNADTIPVLGMPNGMNGSVQTGQKKIYPNDLCPCGSGKKYKKCCGRK